MKLTEAEIIQLAPDAAAVKAGGAMARKEKWITIAASDRVIWGEIKGSAALPYQTAVDIQNTAFKCSCPSRKFPCLHGLGLLLLFAKEEAQFLPMTEPNWVEAWISKRIAKLQSSTEPPKIQSPEALEKLEKGRQKRADDRFDLVESGLLELDQWLKDLIRAGLLQLPSRPPKYFEKIAARMVDAKAAGFANFVRRLSQLDYVGSDQWKEEALDIITKMYLLIDAFRNLSVQSEPMQLSIKNLVGWNLSPKELLESDVASIDDQWLVLGHEKEEIDEIVVHRHWFSGLESGRSAIILEFATRFNTVQQLFVPGTVYHASFLFFNTAWQQRAVMKTCLQETATLSKMPQLLDSIEEMLDFRAQVLGLFPWANDIPVLLRNVRLVPTGDFFEIVDIDGYLLKIHPNTSRNTCLNWLLHVETEYQSVAGILRDNSLLPLGIFVHNQYVIL